MKVRVYRNLHRKCLSVQAQVNGKWKVVDHVASITLCDVRFKVSESGRQRVLCERRKNVHAFVEGYVSSATVAGAQVERASYNPYTNATFVTAGEVPIYEAAFARVTTGGVDLLRQQA